MRQLSFTKTGQEEVFQAETENETGRIKTEFMFDKKHKLFESYLMLLNYLDIGCEGLMDENVEMSAQLESDEGTINYTFMH